MTGLDQKDIAESAERKNPETPSMPAAPGSLGEFNLLHGNGLCDNCRVRAKKARGYAMVQNANHFGL